MLDIQITKTTSPKAKPADESKLGFGKIFTDHMFVMDYAPDKGWHDARIVPYQPFPLDPACVIFHYAITTCTFPSARAFSTIARRSSRV